MWEELPAMHEARGRAVGVVVQDKLLIAGGRGDTGSKASVEEYSPETRSWARLADLPWPRNGSCAALVPGEGWIIAGGCEGPTALPSSSVVRFDLSTRAWTELPSMSMARIHAGAAALSIV